MRLLNLPKGAWLTINRECNMRCKWCYAQESNYDKNDNMAILDAKKAIDMIESLGIKNVILIGGEPTKHKDIVNIIEYCKYKGIQVCMVTNGLAFENLNYLKKLTESGLRKINLSIKGDSKQTYIDNTSVDCYSRILKSILNIINEKIDLTVSYVLTNDNVNGLNELCLNLAELGVRSFYFSFCNPYYKDGEIADYKTHPFILMDAFIKQVDKLIENKINFNFHMTLPLCLWPENFIRKMVRHNCLSTTCQLQNKSGLIFDPKLNLIMCNSLYQFPYGIYGRDFSDAETLKVFLSSKETFDKYKSILRAPHKNCENCDYFSFCAGGCVLQWIYYDFDQLLKIKEDYYASKT